MMKRGRRTLGLPLAVRQAFAPLVDGDPDAEDVVFRLEAGVRPEIVEAAAKVACSWLNPLRVVGAITATARVGRAWAEGAEDLRRTIRDLRRARRYLGSLPAFAGSAELATFDRFITHLTQWAEVVGAPSGTRRRGRPTTARKQLERRLREAGVPRDHARELGRVASARARALGVEGLFRLARKHPA
jgi:hypothetical protein